MDTRSDACTPLDSKESPDEVADSSLPIDSEDYSMDTQSNGFKRRKIGGSMSGTKHLYDYFDQDESNKKLARMIILHGLPLSMVDYREFREFLLSLQPLLKIPSRNTIRNEVLNIYEYEKDIVMKMLERNESRIAITTDMWSTSDQKNGFMEITAHYIDNNWKIQNRIIRFSYVPYPHTSDVLASVLFDCMFGWNLDRSLSTLTVDNCTINDIVVKNLLERLPPSPLIIDGKLLHMSCCARILNSIVQDSLSIIEQVIEKVRDTFAYWSSSSERVQKFEEYSRQLQIECTKKLSLDFYTQWNSTYLMLMVALNYKKVFMRLELRDEFFKCGPTSDEWDVAEEVCNKLHVFYEVAEKLYGNKYPTSNILFPQMCKIRFALFSWQPSSFEKIKSMTANMTQKFEKYWFSIHEIMTISIILDPRYKMKLLQFYFPKLYGNESSVEIAKVKTLCSKLVEEYQSRDSRTIKQEHDVMQSCDGESSLDVLEDYLDKDWNEFMSYVRETNEELSKSELDQYLEEKLSPRSMDFDILVWWKVNGPKWPTLQKIARDILAMPVSSVASEFAFNFGSRMIAPNRSKLNSETVEALMCAQNWLWNEIRDTCSPERNTLGSLNDYDEDDEI